MKLNEYSRTILFDSEKHLSKKKLIQRYFQLLKSKRISLFKILVEGHTDSDGSNEMNQTLSENRAAAVKIT
jgi:outer membrane protein OmpA-like peptidoglycan-associated protein